MRVRWGWFLLFPLFASLALLVGSQFEFLKQSFYKDLGLGRVGTTFGFENYTRIFDSSFYMGSIRTTVELSFYAAVIGIVLAYPVAYTIARMRSRWTMVMIATILLASLITVPIKVLGLMIIFSREGALNRFLLRWHLVDSPVTILGNETGVVVGLIYYSLAFAVLLLYSVIKTISVSLEDAAKIHGCGQWRAFWKVVFPLSIPGIVAVGLTVFNLSMGGFAAAALMGGGRVLTLPVLIHRTMIVEAKYGVAATLSVVLLVLALVLNVISTIVISFWLGRKKRKRANSAVQDSSTRPRSNAATLSVRRWRRRCRDSRAQHRAPVDSRPYRIVCAIGRIELASCSAQRATGCAIVAYASSS
jgi:putative spermidine/putrescine transport system permease protein